ncbi:hypothetical protein O6H91_07G006600 [Diphasiastrum complanatum]|uniref:Uncharacterized protein n=1 Tax=Diphasiastrum complanatum TaxID=34168 RepID=A0ACC2D208_DIPCM|nr:hypothetical protein O6H91_07G006600 [Diphasiastrum complanatum]
MLIFWLMLHRIFALGLPRTTKFSQKKDGTRKVTLIWSVSMSPELLNLTSHANVFVTCRA